MQIFPMISAIDVGKPDVSASLNSQAMNPVASLRPMCRKEARYTYLPVNQSGLTVILPNCLWFAGESIWADRDAAELPLVCR